MPPGWHRPRSARALAAAYRQSGLKFGIGLSPFELHHDDSGAAREALRNKVRQLNLIGVDLLCVLSMTCTARCRSSRSDRRGR